MSGSNLDRGAERRRLLRAIETAPEDCSDVERGGRRGTSSAGSSGGDRSGSDRSERPGSQRVRAVEAATGELDATGRVAASGGPDASAAAGSSASGGGGATGGAVERQRTAASAQSAGFVPEWRCPRCGTCYAARPETCRCCGPSGEDEP